ncbi:TPA: methionyl-tRNA formyltransferase [Aeromonas veronii]
MYNVKSTTIKVFATGLKGLKTIQGIRAKTKDLVVIIGRDSNVKNDYSDEIERYCDREGIPYDTNEAGEFGLAIAAGWQRMIYDIPSTSLIVFHDSLLPKYRGFNPLVSALLNKDDYIGVTALMAADKYDCGDIVCQKGISVEYPILIQDAIEKISGLYFELAGEIYELFTSNRLEGKPQNEIDATYSLWRDNDDYMIDWSDTSENIELQINSLGFPYLGASSFVNNELVRIKRAILIDDVVIENRAPGKIIFFDEDKPVVVCGKGLIRLDHIESDDGKLYKINKFRTRFK